MSENKYESVHGVPVPVGIDEKMVSVAKYYVTNKLKDGFTMQKMFTHFSMAGKTFYSWLEKPEYQKYIDELMKVIIPDDELQAVRKFRKKVMAFADKQNLSSAEMKLFQDLFAPIIQADIKMQMEKLGLDTDKQSTSSSAKTLEEKKAIILQRLKG